MNERVDEWVNGSYCSVTVSCVQWWLVYKTLSWPHAATRRHPKSALLVSRANHYYFSLNEFILTTHYTLPIWLELVLHPYKARQ